MSALPLGISYGAAPAAGEIEVSIFGPGFGEAIAVHVGNAEWILVDSCINPWSKSPATSHYLDAIGVTEVSVKAIVASHWHDDHVKGLARLVERYAAAELQISSVFRDDEAKAFLVAYSGKHASGLSRGSTELLKSIEKSNRVSFVHQKQIVYEEGDGAERIRATAFSPTPQAVAKFVARAATYIPKSADERLPIIHAPRELDKNFESIVLHLEFPGDAVLLGADLEEDANLGWSQIAGTKWCLDRKKATLYKIAHHGSETGEHPDIWARLLTEKPAVGVTPFKLGNIRLPRDTDIERMKAYASSVHISSGATMSPQIDAAQLKRLKQIAENISPVNAGFGVVRYRKLPEESAWRVDLFGDARKL